MNRGFDNFTMVDSQLATRRRKGTELFLYGHSHKFQYYARRIIPQQVVREVEVEFRQTKP
jgi:hypothetical protein